MNYCTVVEQATTEGLNCAVAHCRTCSSLLPKLGSRAYSMLVKNLIAQVDMMVWLLDYQHNATAGLVYTGQRKGSCDPLAAGEGQDAGRGCHF